MEGDASAFALGNGAPRILALRALDVPATGPSPVAPQPVVAMPAFSKKSIPVAAWGGIALGATVLAMSSGRAEGRVRGRGRAHIHRLAVPQGVISTGQRVVWNGCPGTTKYVGTVSFASGEWIGIELDEPKGMHNGTVFKDTYFSCAPRHGVFCQPADLSLGAGGGAAPAAVAASPAAVAAPVAAAPSPGMAPSSGMAVGQKVQWKGNAGTVKFVGQVSFASEEMVGVELDTPKGMHNGSLFGKTYFTCTDKHGVFCKASELGGGAAPAAVAAPPAPMAAAPAPVAAPPSPVPAAAPAAAGGAVSVGQKVSWKGNSGTVKFVGKVSFAAEPMVGVELDAPNGMHNGSLFGQTYFTCTDKHGLFCKASDLGGGAAPAAAAPVPVAAAPAPMAAAPAPVAAPPSPVPAAAPAAAGGAVSVGQKVQWKGNPGTVKFVGTVSFAAEPMVGVELDAPKGMHNGSLFGQSYFTCPDKHGVFCKASDLGGGSAPAPPAPVAAAPAPVAAAPAPVAAPPMPAAPAAAPAVGGAVSVGQKVAWKGNPGTVKFVGKVSFAAEPMVGVELDAPKGMHNGSLFGQSYFTCADKHGVFCKESDLGGGSTPAPVAAAPAPVAAPPVPVAAPPAPVAATPAPVAATPAPAAGGAVSVGQKVQWKGNPGTVKFVGKVDFATEEMVGVELDTPKGMHNGSLFGKTYFTCADKHGVFCKVVELGGGAAAPPAAAPAPPPPMPAAAPPVAAPPVAAPPAPVAAPPPAPVAPPPPAPAAPMPVASAGSSVSSVSVGQKVSWKGHPGTVQYIGAVDFASGEWIGLDLDGQKGLHDGTVFGKSYFTCPMGNGILTQVADIRA